MGEMQLDLIEALATNGAVRRFTNQQVPDETLYSILHWARFAPSGGNRQGWHAIVVKDAALRRRLRELYQLAWREYMAYVHAGLVPFAPGPDGKWGGHGVDLAAARNIPAPNRFADGLDGVPVVLLITASLPDLAVTDVDLNRQSIVGGASVYPFVENVLLCARAEGLGGVMTTVICRQEAEVRGLLHLPASQGVAALMALGWPVKVPKRLSRREVEDFCTVDSFDGNVFRPAEARVRPEGDVA